MQPPPTWGPGPGGFGYGPPPPRSNTVRNLFIAILVVMGLGVFGTAVTCVMLMPAGDAEGGVRMGNQMEPYALDYIRQKSILNGTEKILCYYDASYDWDATESAILTTERLIYDKPGLSTSMLLGDIAHIDSREDGVMGHIIDVQSSSGDRLRIEVALFNDGASFDRALRDAVSLAARDAASSGL